ncbi:MAG TPA: lysoplasmalogenase [Kofleriaceae bacterium]|nr:lysoplasmalogenase [Kofleriaceae bacterium]
MTDRATAIGATVFCAASVIALIGAEWRGDQRARRWAKLAAASGFLMVALAAGATASEFGRRILIGLGFGAAGDIALLGGGARALAAGMGLFACGHLAYLGACAVLVAPGEWVTAWAIAPVLLALVVLRWLWPYLGKFRLPVACYMALFCTTVTAAWAPLLHGAPLRPALLLAAGATAFFFSDLAVARQRFVQASPWNKTWGLPLYFGGQLLIAWSAAA